MIQGVYLAANHDVSDFRFTVAAVRLVISRADRQNKISRVALAFSHQEAAVLAFFGQQLLGLPAGQVSMEPSGQKIHNGKISLNSPHEINVGQTVMATLSLFR